MTRIARLVGFVSLALGIASCGRPGLGDRTAYMAGDPELASAGRNMDTGVWSSAQWGCATFATMPDCMAVSGCTWMESCTGAVTWIPFRPHEQVEVEHDLGYAPTVILTYISFTSTGDTPSQSAGDLTRIVDVSTSTLTVWNDTNGSYFVRIVAF